MKQWRNKLTGGPWTNYIKLKAPYPILNLRKNLLLLKYKLKLPLNTKQWWNAKWNQTLS